MLRDFTRPMRRRAGLLLALTYMACVLGSALALGLGEAAAAYRCVSHDGHAAAAVHAHDDGDGHRHAHQAPAEKSGGSDEPGGLGHKSGSGQCCGVFCVSAATNEAGVAIEPAPRGSTLVPQRQAGLKAFGPRRIDRPPIVLLSL